MAFAALSPVGNLTGSLSAIPTLSGSLSVAGGEIDVSKYEDPDVYDITPKAFESQVFQTAGKMMTNNVTVREVPFYTVSNTSGGTTVYIAKEGA